MLTNAEESALRRLDFHIGDRPRIRSSTECPLTVVNHLEVDITLALQGIDVGIDRPVTLTGDHLFRSIDPHYRGHAAALGCMRIGNRAVLDEIERGSSVEIFLIKGFPYIL